MKKLIIVLGILLSSCATVQKVDAGYESDVCVMASALVPKLKEDIMKEFEGKAETTVELEYCSGEIFNERAYFIYSVEVGELGGSAYLRGDKIVYLSKKTGQWVFEEEGTIFIGFDPAILGEEAQRELVQPKRVDL